ncbi:MAG TPA: acyl-CoA dehydrogenase family protein, partial [bacterium]|nr:acyl-CoA dehydrogenase family protein [bacterium]
MDYFLTEEQLEIKKLARQIVEEKIIPQREHFDRENEFPWEIVKTIAASDFFRIFVPEEYEGMGGGVLDMSLVTEELSYGCGGIAICYAASALGAYPIILYGNEEQKRKYLPVIASGEKLAAFALTEPNAGSDVANMRMSAVKEGNYYI